MIVKYDIVKVSNHRGWRNKKVFIYHDGKFQTYRWMSADDLRINKEERAAAGDVVEVVESHKGAA